MYSRGCTQGARGTVCLSRPYRQNYQAREGASVQTLQLWDTYLGYTVPPYRRAGTQTIPCHTSYLVHHDEAEFRQFMAFFNVHTAPGIRLHLLDSESSLYLTLYADGLLTPLADALALTIECERNIRGVGGDMSSLMSPLMCTFLDTEGYFVLVKTKQFGKFADIAIHNRAGGATNVVFLHSSASSQVIPQNAYLSFETLSQKLRTRLVAFISKQLAYSTDYVGSNSA